MKNPTDYPIHDLLSARWSPYAFDPNKTVDSATLHSLFEAARWAMSSYNAQPWRYIVGNRATDDGVWNQVHDVLVEGNKPWTKNASVLALGLAVRDFEHNGKPNKAALHDLGAASASLTFEATSHGLVVHQMIGIDPDKARSVFGIDDSMDAVTALAIGYAGDASAVDEEYAKRDQKKRERKPLSEIIVRGGL